MADWPRDRETGDPRLSGDHVRVVEGAPDRGDAVLVGVVHDHPASAHRVERAVDAVDPATVALELPPAALPAYRATAGDGGSCEMSAALAAAPDRCVGVDGPSVPFLARLARATVAEGPDPGTVRRLASSTWTVSWETARRRIRAAVPGLAADGGSGRTHDCTAADPPSVQAESERREVERGRSLHGVVETPPSMRIRTRVREDHMATEIDGYRDPGDVVAVVGIAHLDGLAERLAAD